MSMFEIDIKGFRQLQKGRPKWHFVRELISNSLDEVSVSKIKVTIKKVARYCTFSVKDDGNGFEKLSDAYTMFGFTKKRLDPTVRGRFNLGEKELASISKKMEVATTTGTVRFDGVKCTKHPKTKTKHGTTVTATIQMNNKEFDTLVERLKLFIVPLGKGIVFIINDNQRMYGGYSEPEFNTEVTLPTVILDEELGLMKNTKRKTKLDVYDSSNDEDAWLCELGIPVQKIDCEYTVNVHQKIPMNTNRDSVSDSYLTKIFGAVLSLTHEELTDDSISEPWVRQGSEDPDVPKEVFVSIRNKRYGSKKVAFWSSDTQANEKALAAGYHLTTRNELSRVEKERLGEIGIKFASEEFKMSFKKADEIPFDGWTQSMNDYSLFVKRICNLIGYDTRMVGYIKDKQISARAYTNGKTKITFNLAHYKGGLNFDPYNEDNLGTILHELAHHKVDEKLSHGSDWYHELERIAGKFVKHHLVKLM